MTELSLLCCILQVHHRFLSGTELMTSHSLPLTSQQAKWSGAPKLALDTVTESNKVRMSGNAMNLPCVGCIILGCVLGLERI